MKKPVWYAGVQTPLWSGPYITLRKRTFLLWNVTSKKKLFKCVGRVMITPKFFNSAVFFVSPPRQEFLASVCLISFSLSVFFHVAGVYKGFYFAVPVYNVVLGPAAACPVVWVFPCHSLKHMGDLDLTFLYARPSWDVLWYNVVRPSIVNTPDNNSKTLSATIMKLWWIVHVYWRKLSFNCYKLQIFRFHVMNFYTLNKGDFQVFWQ